MLSVHSRVLLWKITTQLLKLRLWTAEDAEAKLAEAATYVRELQALQLGAGSGTLIVDASEAMGDLGHSAQQLFAAVSASISENVRRSSRRCHGLAVASSLA